MQYCNHSAMRAVHLSIENDTKGTASESEAPYPSHQRHWAKHEREREEKDIKMCQPLFRLFKPLRVERVAGAARTSPGRSHNRVLVMV